MTTLAIELANVSWSTHGTHVLEDVSLRAEAGTILGLVGRSGAGKTTTLSVALGLCSPTSGRAQVLGVPSAELHRVAGRIGVALDQPAVEPQLSIDQNLHLHALRHGREVDPTRLLDALDLGGLRRRRAARLSQGERQRLGIALALLLDPEVLVLDEPLAHLDPGLARSVMEYLAAEVERKGMTILLSSHQLYHVERSAHYLALIHNGRILLSGSMRDLLAERVSEVWVRARPRETVLKVLEARTSTKVSDLGDDLFKVELSEAHAADLNAELHRAGASVSRLEPHRPSLDDLFHATVAAAGGTEALP